VPTSSHSFVNLLAFTPGELVWVFGLAIACVLVILWPLVRLLLSRAGRPADASVPGGGAGQKDGSSRGARGRFGPDNAPPLPAAGRAVLGRHNALLAVVLALLLFQCVLLMQKDSPTYDEPNHIACGYSYLVTGDFRMSLAQPPLARMLMALPLLFMRPTLNLDTESWRQADDWTFAREFLFHSGNDADSIVFWARFPSVILCLILGFFVFKWSKELYGPRAALFSLLLYAFSPNILAHGRLATTEMALACFSFISAYYFWRLLDAPGLKNALLSALFLGLGLSSKYSGLIFVISFLLIAVVWGLRKRSYGAPQNSAADGRTREDGRGLPADDGLTGSKTGATAAVWPGGSPGSGGHTIGPAPKHASTPFRRDARKFKLLLGYCLAILIIGGLIALLSSGLTMKPVLDYPAVQGKIAKFGEEGVFVFGNPKLGSIAQNLAATLPLPRYVVGTLFNHFHFKRGHLAYLRGEWKLGGWWYYFPITLLLKEPLPLFLLMGLAIYFGIRRRRAVSSAELVLICIPVVSLLWSMAFVRLNIGFRHILFILPFIYVLLGSVLARPEGAAPARDWLRLRYLFSLLLLVWFCIESAMISPHHLAHFNELAGGPKGGVDWLVDSNLDWGQDLKRLRDYVEHHRVESLRLLYFGTAEPAYYGLNYALLTLEDFQNLEDSETCQQYFGEKWAMSVTSYAALLKYAPWLKKIEGREDARIGFSIFIFSPEKLKSVLFPDVELEACLGTAQH